MKFSDIRLFKNLSEEDISELLTKTQSKKRTYSKGEFLITAGEPVRSLGIVLEGTVHIINEDFWGTRSIITDVKKGEIFAEVYALMYPRVCEVSAVAAQECEVLFVNARSIIENPVSCDIHAAIMNNLVGMLAAKNLILNTKIRHMSKKTTREKLISYFSSEELKNKSSDLYIPFDRQELADFLSVDRSAMSKELCRMRDEGYISFRKNHFKLKKLDT